MIQAHRDETGPFDRRAIPAGAIESRWHAADGEAIRRIDWLLPRGGGRGSLLFLPGRGDCYEKYLETLDQWHGEGWRVTAMDWRGQALSGRLGADGTTGHVADFAVWVEDLAAFWAHWRASTPAPHVLVAHSMGGHIALRALAERRVDPAAVVLTAPMLGLLPQWAPARLLHPLARLIAGLGDPRRPAWTASEKPGARPLERDRLLTHDQARYADEAWWREQRPGLAMGPASWGWIAQALASIRLLERPGVLEAIPTPVLILATRADGLVSYRAARRAAERMPRAQLVSFGAEARHEILREADPVRDRALDAIADFLDRMAPIVD
ncbi:alpha/beta fold hydrolase [Novosphingobium album (ex Liu et al. 2023)]|uniref:Alpha/beta hydrolase n=1 Tax=Novosphingobium album (ex Liu et al. 2023) TaxID=3031130 RepID=A0ABT5WRG0_9SPHN|nr:alpha/beta hydrolase [Novosphingobium album (ex Liu et al. 2023)]MDE8652606.1 alpha/beta hydrolase [Novosphingobium album (ex Liu et al. 2023)]